MADLATGFAFVTLMSLFVCSLVRVNILVAIQALGTVLNRIPIPMNVSIAMHLAPRMARYAGHLFLFIVNIRLAQVVFSEIFISDTASVAGGADLLHGGIFLE